MGRELISIKKWYRDNYAVTRVRSDYVQNWLDQLAAKDERFTYLLAGDDFYVDDERKLDLLKEHIDALRQPHHAQPASQAAPDEALLGALAAAEKKIADLEEMFLEQQTRVDELHKAVEQMATVYGLLRAATTDPKALPDAPRLPTRYKWRVVIIGGDQRILNHMERAFHSVKFIQLAGDAAGSSKLDSKRNTFPRADFVAIMTSFIGHSSMDAAKSFYGADAHFIHGSASSLESALQVWIAEKGREAEREAQR